MDTNAADPLAGGLVHSDRLVLVWRALPELPDALALAECNRVAGALLSLVGGLEEQPAPLDEPPELISHLHRLDQKLDLLLDLCGHLVRRELALPPPQALRLGARGIVWEPATPPAAGPGSISLYLQSSLPTPLELPALLTVLPDGHALAEFHGLDRAVVDGLERFVFRRHRRAVALAKRPSEPV
ncbi:PilZ domain-containing protein [Immundisolibacter sp.]|uniref:PilZ domain-containing protein n=1 Tax=Immundisolibacter sp. TaxID=1934948 RepID=UPI003565003F